MIRYQCVLGFGPVSNTIAWFSGGDFAHVDAVLSDGRLLGARLDNGVQIREPNYQKWAKKVVFTLPVTPEKDAAWLSFLMAQIGKPYDKTAIWGFAAGRDWREPDSWFCSELAAAALEQAGACPVLYTPANKITPSGFATVLSAVGAIITPPAIR